MMETLSLCPGSFNTTREARSVHTFVLEPAERDHSTRSVQGPPLFSGFERLRKPTPNRALNSQPIREYSPATLTDNVPHGTSRLEFDREILGDDASREYGWRGN